MNEILEDKQDEDEVDEMEVFTLEQQLVETKKQLEQSKLRFENKRMYELTQKEDRLKDRLAVLQERLNRNQAMQEMKNKIKNQRYRIEEIKNHEVNLEKKMWEFEREKQM